MRWKPMRLTTRMAVPLEDIFMRNIACIILVILLLPLIATAQAPEVRSNIYDITQPLGKLPGVTPQSSPEEITWAIQRRLDLLYTGKRTGRVFLPAGEWKITRPLFMQQDYAELVGAGKGKTILRPAAGYLGMPLVNTSVHSYEPERPFQACNREPLAGVLDASVTGTRYGVRSYTEYPPAQFPQVSHLAVKAPAQVPAWKEGTAYNVNDVVLLQLPNAGRGVDAVCTQAHTAAKANQPLTGTDWKGYWVLRLPYNMQFFADPLAAGPYDATLNRAANWAGVERFTLDFAFVHNTEAANYADGRPLLVAGSVYYYQPQGRSWAIDLTPDGRLTLHLTLGDGTPRSLLLAANCKAAGLYRLAVQVDFSRRLAQAWVRKPGEAEFTRTLNDTAALPAGARFHANEYGYLQICSGESGCPTSGNYRNEPPTDITVAGLHLANTLRYADAPTLQARAGKATNDQFRYFTNDDGTIAFLPLTDHPQSDEEVRLYGRLISVQHGEAAGDAAQQGYGYLHTPCEISGIGRQRVTDMTIVPGPVWGVGIVNWNTLDPKYWNLDIRGGYYAIGDLFLGAQYTIDVRDCELSGSEAAYNGMSNIVYFHNVTINPVGRCGILLSGSNCVIDGVQFGDPQTRHSEYYFRHIFTTIYGGMNALAHITAPAPAGCKYPSKAAFSMTPIWNWNTSMILDDCAVANMGPDAAFLELPTSPSRGHFITNCTACRYTGTPIAAFIRAESPWWNGQVTGLDPKIPAKKLLDYQPCAFPTWKAGATYQPGQTVQVNTQLYECTTMNKADEKNAPATADGGKNWRLVVPRIVFGK